MWNVTTGTVENVATNFVDLSLSVLDDALEHWGRYIDFGSATIDVTVNFVSLGPQVLAQAGSTFAGFAQPLQIDTIHEILTGVDRNGSDADIDVDINADVINGGEYYFGGFDEPDVPFLLFDLFTVLVHEIGHGLGFISLADQNIDAVYDTFVSGPSSAPVFTGPLSTAAFGGNIPLEVADVSHTSDSIPFFVMGPTSRNGERLLISEVELLMLADIGLPLFSPSFGADVLFGFPTNDNVSLLGGDDEYHGEGGVDTISGGDGDDTLVGGAEGDVLNGGSGRDTASYKTALAAVEASIMAGGGSLGDANGDAFTSIENLEGSDFDDTLVGDNAANEVMGNGGADEISGMNGDDTLVGGGGDDTLFGNINNDELFGDAGADRLLGGDGDDTLRGGAGNDSLGGEAGADYHYGEGGDDFARGRGAFDTLYGGDGNDTLIGDAGWDLLFGEAGADLLQGGIGSDTLHGGDGNDTLLGENAHDRIFSNQGDDVARGGSGNDFVFGGFGNDRVEGNAGNDRVNGEGGDDDVYGGPGNDTLLGRAGTDTLFGGAGDDVFIFEPGEGVDVIRDFKTGAGSEDVIDLSAFGADFDSFAEVFAVARQNGPNTAIDFGGGDLISLWNTNVSSLDADDFFFG